MACTEESESEGKQVEEGLNSKDMYKTCGKELAGVEGQMDGKLCSQVREEQMAPIHAYPNLRTQRVHQPL